MKRDVCKDRNKTAPRGFTLIELLVVITIIGILATFVAPRLIGQTEKANEATVKAQVQSLQTTADAYHLSHGRPISAFSDLVSAGLFDADNVPTTDPWGDPYTIERRADGTVRISSKNFERIMQEQRQAASADVTIGR